jgi:hypothetical protein
MMNPNPTNIAWQSHDDSFLIYTHAQDNQAQLQAHPFYVVYVCDRKIAQGY